MTLFTRIFLITRLAQIEILVGRAALGPMSRPMSSSSSVLVIF